MAKARAILKRLKAVRNIRKITRTMELIANARFKKAMDRASEAAAYTRKISELAADLAQSASGFAHPLMEVREERRAGLLLVLTSNRGFCGGYNASVLRLVQQRLREARAQNVPLTLEVSGKRGLNFLRFLGVKVDRPYRQFEDKPRFDEVEEIGVRYIDLYVARKIDFVDDAYVKVFSASKQAAVVETLLPLTRPGEPAGGRAEAPRGPQIEYEYLPSARDILEEILPAAFKARLFKCFLDAAVSEQIFRMVAMKAATENAGEMINDLTRVYNRARQAQITSELSEIIGGAEALK